MSMTAAALFAEICRVDPLDFLSSEALAEALLPFIERHIAAGKQGAELTDDDFRSEWRAAGGEMHGPRVETVSMPEAAYLQFRRRLDTPQLPKPAGAVPIPAPSGETYPFYGLNQLVAYGDVREAAAVNQQMTTQGEADESLHPSTLKWLEQEIEDNHAMSDDDDAEDQKRIVHLERLRRFARRLTGADHG